MKKQQNKIEYTIFKRSVDDNLCTRHIPKSVCVYRILVRNAGYQNICSQEDRNKVKCHGAYIR